MNLNITGITTTLGASSANRFNKLILPVEDPVLGSEYRQEIILNYAWSGNLGAHHVKFGIFTGTPSSQPAGYKIDTQNSISGLESGNATFNFVTYYPSDGTFGDLNFINDDEVNYIQGKAIVVTGSSSDEHYETGNAYVHESYIARPKWENAVGGQTLSISGYGNLSAEYLKMYVGGIAVSGLINNDGHILTNIPSFHNQESVVIEIENGVSRVTGGYLDVVAVPEITEVSPANASWGDSIIVSGKNFLDVTGLFLNSIQISEFTVNSKTEVTFVVPEETEGGYDIVICATGGCSE